VNRRRYLALLAGALPLAGCTGGPGDPITMLAVNQDDTAHSVTAWVVREERLVVASTVEVASGAVERIGETPWRSGRYRVTVQVDGEPVFAREFRSEEWFNQLDVFIADDGSVELNRGRAA
jgi:hypothetical protein